MSVPRVIDNQHGDFLLSIFGSSIGTSAATFVNSLVLTPSGGFRRSSGVNSPLTELLLV